MCNERMYIHRYVHSFAPRGGTRQECRTAKRFAEQRNFFFLYCFACARKSRRTCTIRKERARHCRKLDLQSVVISGQWTINNPVRLCIIVSWRKKEFVGNERTRENSWAWSHDKTREQRSFWQIPRGRLEGYFCVRKSWTLKKSSLSEHAVC